MAINPEAQSWIDLSGKSAHVTGGGKGIGAAIAAALAAAGAAVTVSDIDGAGAEASGEKIGGRGMALDVTDHEAFEAALKATADAQGGLDILVNNAGIYLDHGGPVRDISNAMWDRLWRVNVDGVFFGCRAAAGIMIDQGRGGRMINVSSTQAKTPGVGVTYDGSKAAVLQMTRALALELAPHKINVNALAPGPTWVNDGAPPATGGVPPALTGEPLSDSVTQRLARLPAGHWGDPMEQGKAAVFLASAMSDFVTGAYLPVDGGWLTL